MPNPLYGQFGGQQSTDNGMPNFMADFQRLQQTIKNPRQEVERLLQSGTMSQQTFNSWAQQANKILGGGR